MDSRSRLFATLIIWTAYVLVLVLGVPASNMSDNSAGMVALFGGFAGFLTTGFFWNWGRLPLSGNMPQAEAEKTKRHHRHHRVDSVLDSLTEDELEILRRRLSADDDEQVRLDTLMSHDGEIRRR